MPPKRKAGGGRGGGRGKKAKTEVPQASGPPDLSGKETYCSEVGIDIENGGSKAIFQWLCCSIVFGNRISEKTTIRAAKGLINTGLTDPQSVKDASWQEKVDALNSEGNVQRGPSMSDRLGATADLVLTKYDGDLSKLKEAAKSKPAQIRKLVKEFKGIGETGADIFFREAQLQWEELFPFADKNSLKLAKEHGYPSKNAKELADFIGNDRKKFVALLAALTKDELRNTDILGDKAAEENDAPAEACGDDAKKAEVDDKAEKSIEKANEDEEKHVEKKDDEKKDDEEVDEPMKEADEVKPADDNDKNEEAKNEEADAKESSQQEGKPEADGDAKPNGEVEKEAKAENEVEVEKEAS